MKTLLLILAILPIVAGCQTLGLYKLGIGEKEFPVIKEKHRTTCEQPLATPLAHDQCGRLIYTETVKKTSK